MDTEQCDAGVHNLSSASATQLCYSSYKLLWQPHWQQDSTSILERDKDEVPGQAKMMQNAENNYLPITVILSFAVLLSTGDNLETDFLRTSLSLR